MPRPYELGTRQTVAAVTLSSRTEFPARTR
jgi:hypothetical protein